jgi:hypothetical protein
MLRVSGDAKLLGQGAGVDFGQFGHFGAIVDIALVLWPADIPLSQW